MTTGYTGSPVDCTKMLPYSLANLLIEDSVTPDPVTLPRMRANDLAGAGLVLVLAVVFAIMVCAL